MTKEKAKKILLKSLYENPDKTSKRMFIFGFSKSGLIKKYCTIKNCIEFVEKENEYGLKLIDFVINLHKKSNKL